ncbi:MAG: transcription antitermination protein NusB [Bacteroidales bacterium]|nr:transcription antitermination protein NusB [Bacteroidales bacterium]
MLSRRFLRIKVMQAVYAFLQDGPEDINVGEKHLLNSLDKLYELFIYQLSFLAELSEFAAKRLEDNKLKYLPTAEDLDPNTRFIENSFIQQLTNNREYKKRYNSYKINWIDEEEIVRKCYNQLKELPEYIAYMAAETSSYQLDKQIVEDIFLKLIAESELLQSFYEEKNLYWSDDFDISLTMVLKTIKGYKVEWDEFKALPTLLKDQDDPGGSEDLTFVKQLYRKSILHDEEFTGVISQYADNWDVDRIALMDTILIKLALTEFIDFPFIPVKVTMNEYIEISKGFSTPKSKVFINGILDKLIVDFKQNGRIKKTGRGLLE